MSIRFWIWSHLSFVLLIAGVFCPLFRGRCSVVTQTVGGFAIVGLSVFPLQHVDLSGLVLGHVGVLSASTIILLMQYLSCQSGLTNRRSEAENLILNVVWLLVGGVMYASTFGFFEVDIYALGYQPRMPWVVLAASGLAALARHWLLAVCLATAVLAHQSRLCESPNLWDCIIDPWLFFAAIFQLLWSAIHRKQSGKTPVSVGR